MVYATILVAVAVHSLAAIPWAFRSFTFLLLSHITYFTIAYNYEIDFSYLGLGFFLLGAAAVLIRANNRSHEQLITVLMAQAD